MVQTKWSMDHSEGGGSGDAEAAMLAAFTERKFFHWIPANPNEVEHEFWRADGAAHGIIAWLEPNEDRSHQLDRYDPYASPTAARPIEPTEWLIANGGVVQADPIVKTWTHDGREVLFMTSWGASGGRGDYAWEESGERAVMDTDFLLDLLRRTGKELVMFANARRYFPARSNAGLEGPIRLAIES